MKDIGLGILDRYTVSIAIITLALCSLVVGLPIPFDTSNAIQLIFSLVFFTGYLYITRSLLRLPVAIVRAVIVVDELSGNVGPSYRGFRGIRNRIGNFFTHLRWNPASNYFASLYYVLQITLNFYDDRFDQIYPSRKIARIKSRFQIGVVLLEILDRLSIVALTLLATFPRAMPYVEWIGVIGAVLMLVIFLLRGHFSFMLPDELLKDKKHDEVQIIDLPKKQADSKKLDDNNWYQFDIAHENVTRLGIVSVKVSKCQNCSKSCVEDNEGNLPLFCSLKCLQEWYPTWERDWSIGQERERQIIESQRITGYADYQKMDAAVDELKEIALNQPHRSETFWALIGMVRDVSGEHDSDDRYTKISTVESAFWQIVKKKKFFIEMLPALLLDDNEGVVLFALKFLQKIPPTSGKFNDDCFGSILNHHSWRVRQAAISLLSGLGYFETLYAHLGKTELYENSMILNEFMQSKDSKARTYLEKAQMHYIRSIRREAIESLFKLGIEAKKPELVERSVKCPYEECPSIFTITYPADYMEFAFLGVEELGTFQFRKYRTKCPSCRARIGIKLDRSIVYITRQQNQEWYAKLLAEYKNSK